MQKILLLNSDRLIGAAIAALLQTTSDFTLTDYSPSSTSDLISHLQNIGLDTLIYDSTVTIAVAAQQLLAQLSENLGLRVIAIDATQNMIHVNNRYDLLISRPQDLLDIVQIEPAKFAADFQNEEQQRVKSQIKQDASAILNPQYKHRRPLTSTVSLKQFCKSKLS